MKNPKTRSRFSAAFKTGAVALAFLIIGYQAALFIHQAAVESIVAGTAVPGPQAAEQPAGVSAADPAAPRPVPGAFTSPKAQEIRKEITEKYAPREVETFPFNPNTVSQEDLQRLGFSIAQAQSIIKYREKGGKFNRPEDFARSYVVADSVFKRLEPFISIPRTNLNTADSAAFDALPGIGPYYAAKIVEYRSELGGYSFAEQLMEIWNFDREKYDGLKDLIELGDPPGYPLWALPEAELARHPYINAHTAHSIVLYRETMPREKWTVDELAAAGILEDRDAAKLLRCRISSPSE